MCLRRGCQIELKMSAETLEKKKPTNNTIKCIKTILDILEHNSFRDILTHNGDRLYNGYKQV